MAHALMLTASSSGRAPVPTGDGSTLLVDEANAIMICVAPIPSAWDPEGLALYRGGQRVTTPPMSDGTRWVLMGDERFGTFQARATGAGAPVASPVVRVVPATVSLRADRAPAGQPRQPGQPREPGQPRQPGEPGQPGQPGQPREDPVTAELPREDPAIVQPVPTPEPVGPAQNVNATSRPPREDPAIVQPVPTPEPVGPAQNVNATPRPPAGVGPTVPPHGSSTTPRPPAGAGPHATSPALSAGAQALRGGSDIGSRTAAPASAPPPAPRVPSASGAPAHPVLAATGDRRDAELPTPTATPASTIRPEHLSGEPAAHLQPIDDPPPGATSPIARGVVEVPLSEYDGRFAAVVAFIFSLLAVIVLSIVAMQVIGDLIIATPIPADTPTPDANSAARSARATSALLIGIGVILLLAAAALAALDVRGRQRRDARTSTALRGTQATLDKAPGILENPGRFRGTLALLVTGVVVVMIGFLGQVHWS